MVLPGAILVRTLKAKVLCSDSTCPSGAEYRVQLPHQAPVPYCPRHSRATVQRATGKPANLEKMVETTQERERTQPKGRYTSHWTSIDRVDYLMDGVGVQWDTALCGAYVPLPAITDQPEKVRCEYCRRKMKRLRPGAPGAPT